MNDSIDTPYEAPAVTDHGTLTDLTESTLIAGLYDRNYNQNNPNPPGNLDSSAP